MSAPLQNELDVVRDLTARLTSLDLAFMITGSMAMNYYAEPRMTRDIDVVVALGVNDAVGLVKTFEDDYYVSIASVEKAIVGERMFNAVHQASVIKVDFIVRKSAEYRRAEFDRRVKVKILDFETYIVSKEDLILSKLVWSKESRSELQRRDIVNLLSSDYNAKYVDEWAVQLDVAELLGELREG